MIMPSTRTKSPSKDPRAGSTSAKRGSEATGGDNERGKAKKQAKEAPKRGASLRKLTPKVEMPTPTVLKRFSVEEVATLEKLLSEPMECVYHDAFPRVNAEQKFLTPLEDMNTDVGIALGGDPDAPAASSTRSLTAAEERELFLCLNYCRYRTMRVIRYAKGKRLSAKEARELLRWHAAAHKSRTYILQANLSLVPAMAKRSKTVGVDIGDLICEGNLALLRSVDKFDCMRGFKFSTYACRAILSSFSSSAAKSARYRSYFPTEFDPALERSDFLEKKRENVEQDCVADLREVLLENAAGLSAVEQRVLAARFDLNRDKSVDGPPRAKTLKQVAELIGVTKERVRQIQNKALDKLRNVVEDDILAA
jgi:RNA polymerase primary sigma factor